MAPSVTDLDRARLRRLSIEGMAALAEMFMDEPGEWCSHRPRWKATRTWQIPVFVEAATA